MATPHPRTSRAEQRRRSEERILATARQMFADVGFERTTIRAVAAGAGVDPGLVMHYFGSKADLLARAAQGAAPQTPGDVPTSADDVVEMLMASLASRLDGEPSSSLALLRSMLTNPEAADRYRAAAGPELDRIAAAIPGGQSELRAALLGAVVHGVIIERHLLRMSRLADAPAEEILDLLRPCVEQLVTGWEAPPPTS